MPEMDILASTPQWMKPPSWRWTAAMKLASAAKKPPTWSFLQKKGFPKDRYLLRAARYYFISYTPGFGGAKVARIKQPDMYRASQIFKGRDYFAYWKTLLESMLLTKLTLHEIAEKLGLGKDINLLKLYRAIFFDMDPDRDTEAVIQANAITMSCKGDSLEPTDEYLAKLIAYTRGYNAFYRMFVSKESPVLTEEDSEWFQNFIRSKLAFKAAKVASSQRSEYISENIEMLRTGREWLLTEDVDPDALGKKAKSEALSTLLSTVHEVCDENNQATAELTEAYENYAEIGWNSTAGAQKVDDDEDVESK